MKRIITAAAIAVVLTGCMASKQTPVRQESAKAQQAKAAAAQAEMERDIQAGTPSLDFADKPVQKPAMQKMPSANQPMKLGSLKPQTKYPIKDGYPVWFFTPVYDGYVGAVGIAPKQGSYTAQKRVARMQAQKNLAKQINVLVKSEVVVQTEGVDTATVQYYREKVKSLTREEVDQYLSGFHVQDEWIDDGSGEYYMWMVLKR